MDILEDQILVRRDTLAGFVARGIVPANGEPVALMSADGKASTLLMGNGADTVDLLPALSKGDKGATGKDGSQGLPGVNAVPADEAVASYIGTDGASETKAALTTAVASISDQRAEFPGPRPQSNPTPLTRAILSNRGGNVDDTVVPKTLGSGTDLVFASALTQAQLKPWFSGGGTPLAASWNGNPSASPSSQGGTNNDLGANQWSLRFVTTSSWILFRAHLASSGAWSGVFQIKVDGVPLWDNPRDLGGSYIGAAGALYLEFRTTTPKVVEIFHTTKYVLSLSWDSAATTTALPVDATRKRLAVIGDSWNAGTAQAGTLGSYAHVLQERSSWEVSHQGQGGTGYVSGDGSQDYFRTFGDPARVAAYTESKPDLIVLVGSINDRGKAGIQAAATALFAAVKSASPTTKIMVVGAQNVESADVSAALLSAVGANGGDNVIGFVDPVAEGWITPDVTGPVDPIHPSPAGAEYIAYRLQLAIKRVTSSAGLQGW